MNDNPHFGVATIDNPTLPSGQDKVNNIKRYGFSRRTGPVFRRQASGYGEGHALRKPEDGACQSRHQIRTRGVPIDHRPPT
jgi:hypothetical protein